MTYTRPICYAIMKLVDLIYPPGCEADYATWRLPMRHRIRRRRRVFPDDLPPRWFAGDSNLSEAERISRRMGRVVRRKR